MTTVNYAALTNRQIVGRIARNAASINAHQAALDALYDERIALFRAARARPTPVPYGDLAAAAGTSKDAVFKAFRTRNRAAVNGRP